MDQVLPFLKATVFSVILAKGHHDSTRNRSPPFWKMVEKYKFGSFTQLPVQQFLHTRSASNGSSCHWILRWSHRSHHCRPRTPPVSRSQPQHSAAFPWTMRRSTNLFTISTLRQPIEWTLMMDMGHGSHGQLVCVTVVKIRKAVSAFTSKAYVHRFPICRIDRLTFSPVDSWVVGLLPISHTFSTVEEFIQLIHQNSEQGITYTDRV